MIPFLKISLRAVAATRQSHTLKTAGSIPATVTNPPVSPLKTLERHLSADLTHQRRYDRAGLFWRLFKSWCGLALTVLLDVDLWGILTGVAAFLLALMFL